jgi:hypothetical protein
MKRSDQEIADDDPTGEEPGLEFDPISTDVLDDTYRFQVVSASEHRARVVGHEPPLRKRPVVKGRCRYVLGDLTVEGHRCLLEEGHDGNHSLVLCFGGSAAVNPRSE